MTCPISGGSVVASHKTISDYGPTTRSPGTRTRTRTRGREPTCTAVVGWASPSTPSPGLATGATTVTEFDNVTRDRADEDVPVRSPAPAPRRTRFVTRMTRPLASSEHVTTTITRSADHESGTYTVEQRLAIVAEDEHPVGASMGALRLTRTETSYDEFGNPDVVTRRPRTAARSPRTSTTTTTPPPGCSGCTTRTPAPAAPNDDVCTTREINVRLRRQGQPNRSPWWSRTTRR